ncbi:hypothetical protein [uncultured Agrobacterium sp.]|uniref:hypothetical protein n=1 Tax=uncultured Agrobacterium sp. TaxID=157277 RepID=UPI0025DE2AFC|nr:hypothetical protein [uncultured Agrobacterium sp.]
MRFIRNWVIPFFSTVIFAFIGLLITGSPGYNIVMTFDGQPIDGGPTPEQVDATIARGTGLDSHVDFYGIALPGEPLFWMIGIVLVAAFIDYKFGSAFKMPASA